MAHSATHDMHDMHDAPNVQDVSFTNKVNHAKLIRFSKRFKTSSTAGFKPTELRKTKYATEQIKVFHHGPWLLSNKTIDWIGAMENVRMQIVDTILSERLEQGEKSAIVCTLTERLATKVKDLGPTEPVQDVPSRELVAAPQAIEVLESELQIKKQCCAKLECWLNKCKSEPETAELTDIIQLQLENVMLLHQVNNLLLVKSNLECKGGAFELVFEWWTTDLVHHTQAHGASEPTSDLSGFHGLSEPTPALSGSRGFSFHSSDLLTYEGKWTLDNVTSFLVALEHHFNNAAQAIEWVGTTDWVEQAVL